MKDKFLVFIFLISCFVMPLAVRSADLELSGGAIRAVNGIRIGHENWANVTFGVKNNSNKKRSIKIIFRHSKLSEGVYEYLLDVPAKTSINHYFPVAMGSSPHISKKAFDKNQKNSKAQRKQKMAVGSYIISILEKSGDRYIPVEGAKKVNCNMDFSDLSGRKAVAIFTDEVVDIGNLSKKLKLHNDFFRMTNVDKGTWPEHWSTYSAFDMLLFMRPKYESFNALAIKAIKDYVKMGGTIIFAHHDGIMKAGLNEFQDLLPVIPLNVRTVNHIPELNKYLGTKKEITSEEGIKVVESVSKKGSFTALTAGEYPLIVWKKYGLGMTLAINVSPSQPAFNNNGAEGFRLLLLGIIGDTARPADLSLSRTNNARNIVNDLNGITIPGPGVILNYMLVYISLTLVLFLVLAKFKKTMFAWGFTIIFSLGFTAVIFNKAYSGNQKGSKDRLAAVFTQKVMVQESPEVKVYSIFSKNNEKLNLKGNYYRDRFRKLPRVKVDYSQMLDRAAASKHKVEQVVTSLYEKDSASLSELYIQGLSTRVFSVQSHGSSTSMAVPKLTFSPDGLTVKSTEFPNELKNAELIYLAGPSGQIILERNGDELKAMKKQSSISKFDDSLRNTLSNLSLNRPILVFVNKGVTEDEILDDSFSVNGLNLFLAPLREIISGELLVPGEFCKMEPTDTSRNIFRDAKWSGTRYMGRKEKKYDVIAKLPLLYRSMKVSEVVVDLKYMNKNKNIILDVSIGGIKGKLNAEGKYVFTKVPTLKGGALNVSIHCKAKVNIMDPIEAFKTNFWQIEHFKVSFKGKLQQSKSVEF